jgi:hypothetical protein
MATKARNFKQEWKTEQARSEVEKPRRAARARARRAYDAKGINRAGKDIDHNLPLSLGGSTKLSNTSLKTPSANRSFPRQANSKPKKRKGA